jgi:hypothetical protein
MIALAATAALLSAGSAQAARKTPEEQLAWALRDRVPGKPIDCLYQQQITSTQIIPRTAIIYQVGSTLYVNTPRSGKEFLDQSDIMVTDTHSNQLCSIDIVRLLDQSSHMQSGTLGLDKFVPYTKPK